MSPMKLFAQFSLAAVVISIIGVTYMYFTAPKKSDPATIVAQARFYDLEEQVQPLAQWKGKVLVINFWATWCPPCRAEIPEFIKFQKEYGAKGVQFVGIAIDQRSKAKSFAEEMKMNYPILMGDLAGIELAKMLGDKDGGLPYSVIVDRYGKVSATKLGTLSYPELEKLITPLL